MDVKIKICGLMSVEDVRLINAAKPHYAGFVFAPVRHRIDKSLAVRMRNALDERIPAVGVFVEEPISGILQLVKDGVIDMIQLHGRETPGQVMQIREGLRELSAAQDVPIIKAIRMGTDDGESREVTGKPVALFSGRRPACGKPGGRDPKGVALWGRFKQRSRDWRQEG